MCCVGCILDFHFGNVVFSITYSKTKVGKIFNKFLWNDKLVLMKFIGPPCLWKRKNPSFGSTPLPRRFTVRVLTMSMLLNLDVQWPDVRSTYINPIIGIVAFLKQWYLVGFYLYWRHFALLHFFRTCSAVSLLMKLLGFPVLAVQTISTFSDMILIQNLFRLDKFSLDGLFFLNFWREYNLPDSSYP